MSCSKLHLFLKTTKVHFLILLLYNNIHKSHVRNVRGSETDVKMFIFLIASNREPVKVIVAFINSLLCNWNDFDDNNDCGSESANVLYVVLNI